MEGKFERRSTLRPLVMGLAAGAVIGGLVGLLLAPRTGKETRQKLGNIAYKVRERIAGHPVEIHSISKN
ncbi:MAG: YtxH domain-containing protein [Chloroflexi bacterium]|nr:YtxH domain-containing protein [Chloroflexota bacterium]